MPTLRTPRLVLAAIPPDMMRVRLEQDRFSVDVPAEGGALRVHVGPEWPGAVLGLFHSWLTLLERDPAAWPWNGVMIDRSTHEAVGAIGFKDLPRGGSVEIGYGVNPSWWGQGLATEAAGAVTRWALAQPDVERVLAECLETNVGSARVLAKAGFACVGQRTDTEGTLLQWERRAEQEGKYERGRNL